MLLWAMREAFTILPIPPPPPPPPPDNDSINTNTDWVMEYVFKGLPYPLPSKISLGLQSCMYHMYKRAHKMLLRIFFFKCFDLARKLHLKKIILLLFILFVSHYYCQSCVRIRRLQLWKDLFIRIANTKSRSLHDLLNICGLHLRFRINTTTNDHTWQFEKNVLYL